MRDGRRESRGPQPAPAGTQSLALTPGEGRELRIRVSECLLRTRHVRPRAHSRGPVWPPSSSLSHEVPGGLSWEQILRLRRPALGRGRAPRSPGLGVRARMPPVCFVRGGHSPRWVREADAWGPPNLPQGPALQGPLNRRALWSPPRSEDVSYVLRGSWCLLDRKGRRSWEGYAVFTHPKESNFPFPGQIRMLESFKKSFPRLNHRKIPARSEEIICIPFLGPGSISTAEYVLKFLFLNECGQ